MAKEAEGRRQGRELLARGPVSVGCRWSFLSKLESLGAVPVGSYSIITDPNHKTRLPQKGVGYEVGFVGCCSSGLLKAISLVFKVLSKSRFS